MTYNTIRSKISQSHTEMYKSSWNKSGNIQKLRDVIKYLNWERIFQAWNKLEDWKHKWNRSTQWTYNNDEIHFKSLKSTRRV